jgi:hypothetical protein
MVSGKLNDTSQGLAGCRVGDRFVVEFSPVTRGGDGRGCNSETNPALPLCISNP